MEKKKTQEYLNTESDEAKVASAEELSQSLADAGETEKAVTDEADSGIVAVSDQNKTSEYHSRRSEIRNGRALRREAFRRGHASGTDRPAVLLTYLAPGVLLLAFFAYSFFSTRASGLGFVLSALTVFFVSLILVRLVPRFVSFFQTSEPLTTAEKLGERSLSHLHPHLKIIAASLLAQLALIYLIYALDGIRNGYTQTVFESYSRLFISPHGLLFGSEMRNGISALGFISLILPSFFERTIVGSGLVLPVFLINTILNSLVTINLYELLVIDYDKRSAKFGCVLLYTSPTVLLILQPLSWTSIFLVFALFSVYLTRKGKYLLSGFSALFSCFFNLFGSLLFIIILLEGIRNSASSLKETDDQSSSRKALLTCSIGAFVALVPMIATVLLRFTAMSGRLAPSGRALYPFETLASLSCDLSTTSPYSLALIAIFTLLLCFALMFMSFRKLRVSYAAYCLLYAAAASSFLGNSLFLWSVFSFPLLTVMQTSILSRKFLRIIYPLVFLIVTALLIVFFYLKRSAS